MWWVLFWLPWAAAVPYFTPIWTNSEANAIDAGHGQFLNPTATCEGAGYTVNFGYCQAGTTCLGTSQNTANTESIFAIGYTSSTGVIAWTDVWPQQTNT